VPDGVYESFRDGIGRRGRALRDAWTRTFADYKNADPQAAREVELLLQGRLPEQWDRELPTFPADAKGLATRESSGKVLDAIAKTVPWLIGGAGDLAPSTKTAFPGAEPLEADDPGGRVMHFGVREHAMGAIVNGLVLCKLRAFGATFLTFSDYMRPAIRLAALMQIPVFHVFTHDSIGLGEDGPTHQPIEQLVGLRAIPGLVTIRPADANEVTEGWRFAIESRRPTALSLTRQAVPTFDRTVCGPASALRRGAYILVDDEKRAPDVILIATGSEVALCTAAREALKKEGIRTRVVSMPSWELFEEQDGAYRDSVLPPSIRARVSVEAGSPIGWERYTGPTGARIAMTSFGASGPYQEVYRHFHFTVEHIVEAANEQIARNKGG